MMKRIDNKFAVTSEGDIISVRTGAPIPDHEPKILFRGKDKLAIPMMQYYLELCIQNGCTKEQEESMRAMIEEFREYKNKFASVMKTPD